MISKTQAQVIATQWLEAWNAHDLDTILSHYSDDITLVSPIAERLIERSSGQVTGEGKSSRLYRSEKSIQVCKYVR